MITIDWLIPQGSTYAADIDQVIGVIGLIVGFWWLVTQGMFTYLLWEYREKAGVKAAYYTGHEHDLHKWVAYPHYLIILCDVVVIYFAVSVWYNVKQVIPENEDQEIVRVVAQQWAWSFQHPGADGELGTDDDIFTVDELHVQSNRTMIFNLESRDVMHSFSVPVWRIKQDIIPGRIITGWVTPTLEGEFDLQCAEMCGVGHGIMGAKVFVESPEQHANWIAANSGPVASR